MTNGETSEKLLADAARIAREVDSATADGAWNLAVRRAQEVVELALKAVLRVAGTEYPKTHDPAPIVVQVLSSRGIQIEPSFAGWIQVTSKALEGKRAPAFYHEAEFGEEDARQAAAAAHEVFRFASELAERLISGAEREPKS